MIVIATLIYVSVSGVLLSNMLDDFIGPGMIFERWGNYLERNPNKWYLAPLLGCLICSNIWITSGCLVCFFFAPMVLQIFFVLSLSHWLLNIMAKYELL